MRKLTSVLSHPFLWLSQGDEVADGGPLAGADHRGSPGGVGGVGGTQSQEAGKGSGGFAPLEAGGVSRRVRALDRRHAPAAGYGQRLRQIDGGRAGLRTGGRQDQRTELAADGLSGLVV